MVQPAHLSPEAITKFKQLEKLQSMEIFHSSLNRVLQEVDAFLLTDPTKEKRGLSLLGEAGVGKSHSIKMIQERYRHKKIVSCVLDAGGTEKMMIKSILKALGDPLWDNTRQDKMQLRERAIINMKDLNVEVLIIDEVQHLVKSEKKRVQFDMADWVKTLIDTLECHIIFVGLPYVACLYDVNLQFDRRIGTKLTLDPFRWDQAKGTKEFARVLHNIEKALPVDYPVINEVKVIRAIYDSTMGHIDLMIRFLRASARAMIFREGNYLTLDDMGTAHFELHPNLEMNPFSYLLEQQIAA